VEKLLASYDWLNDELAAEAPLHVGHIALATTLGWLEFRELPTFRQRPRLARWFEEFSQRPSMLATPLWGQTHD
jgi:glutathione S-transferase